MRDEQAVIEAHNMVVIGVSYDSVESNRKFAEKQDFNFLLLSDRGKTTAKAYGAKGLIPLAKRISYVIDEEGNILFAYPDVNPKTHIDVILHDLNRG